jgi:hypothetical protein
MTLLEVMDLLKEKNSYFWKGVCENRTEIFYLPATDKYFFQNAKVHAEVFCREDISSNNWTLEERK